MKKTTFLAAVPSRRLGLLLAISAVLALPGANAANQLRISVPKLVVTAGAGPSTPEAPVVPEVPKAAMTVTSVSPSVLEVAGGAPVVSITGTNFDTDVAVTFAGASASCSTVSAELIQCTPPARPGAGMATVTLTDASDSRVASAADAIEYVLLAVNSITPTNLSTVGGQPVTIAGRGFMPGVTASIGGQAMTCSSVTESSLSCVSPAAVEGLASLSVSNQPGSALTLPSAVTYTEPTVFSVFDSARLGAGLVLDSTSLIVSQSPVSYSWRSALGTRPKSSGRYYFEVVFTSNTLAVGIASSELSNLGTYAASQANAIQIMPTSPGVVRAGTTLGTTGVGPFAQGTTIGVNVDLDAKTVRFVRKLPTGSCGAAGTVFSFPAFNASGYVPVVSLTTTAGAPRVTANFGQSPFVCPVPAGVTPGWY